MEAYAMFRLKIHRDGRETLVAASDADLVGQTFRGDGLKITVHEHFYGDPAHEADEGTLVRELGVCTVANLVGERVVGLAIRHGFVEPGSVLRIGGVPHAQVAVL